MSPLCYGIVAQALRYDPPQNCADIAAFAWGVDDGWSCDEVDHENAEFIVDDGVTLRPGDWLVRWPEGRFEVFTDERFMARFLLGGAVVLEALAEIEGEMADESVGPDDDDYLDRPALGRTHPYGNGAV